MNVSIGYLVSILKLPLYLDSIGTVFISVLFGWKFGVITGLAGLVIMTLTVVPTVLPYAGTVVALAIVSAVLARAGFLRNVRVTIFGGLLLGLIASLFSVPVTTFLYGGVSLAGSDAITTFFKASGMPVWKSVLFGSLITDPLDKFVTALICFFLMRSLSPRMLERISHNRLPFPDDTTKSGTMNDHV